MSSHRALQTRALRGPPSLLKPLDGPPHVPARTERPRAQGHDGPASWFCSSPDGDVATSVPGKRPPSGLRGGGMRGPRTRHLRREHAGPRASVGLCRDAGAAGGPVGAGLGRAARASVSLGPSPRLLGLPHSMAPGSISGGQRSSCRRPAAQHHGPRRPCRCVLRVDVRPGPVRSRVRGAHTGVSWAGFKGSRLWRLASRHPALRWAPPRLHVGVALPEGSHLTLFPRSSSRSPRRDAVLPSRAR